MFLWNLQRCNLLNYPWGLILNCMIDWRRCRCEQLSIGSNCVDMASNGLFWRFWWYIVSEIQNEKTASSRPSLLLGVGPRGPLEVPRSRNGLVVIFITVLIKPNMAWSYHLTTVWKSRLFCHVVLSLEGVRTRWRIPLKAMANIWRISLDGVRTRVGGIAQGDRKPLFARWRSYSTEYRLRR